MVKKATRNELFNAAAGICGRIYGVELKYGPLVAAERARRDRAVREMGVTRRDFV